MQQRWRVFERATGNMSRISDFAHPGTVRILTYAFE